MMSIFPRDVLDEVLDLLESVYEVLFYLVLDGKEAITFRKLHLGRNPGTKTESNRNPHPVSAYV